MTTVDLELKWGDVRESWRLKDQSMKEKCIKSQEKKRCAGERAPVSLSKPIHSESQSTPVSSPSTVETILNTDTVKELSFLLAAKRAVLRYNSFYTSLMEAVGSTFLLTKTFSNMGALLAFISYSDVRFNDKYCIVNVGKW